MGTIVRLVRDPSSAHSASYDSEVIVQKQERSLRPAGRLISVGSGAVEASVTWSTPIGLFPHSGILDEDWAKPCQYFTKNCRQPTLAY